MHLSLPRNSDPFVLLCDLLMWSGRNDPELIVFKLLDLDSRENRAKF